MVSTAWGCCEDKRELECNPVTVRGCGVCLLDVSTGLGWARQGERRLRDWFWFLIFFLLISE